MKDNAGVMISTSTRTISAVAPGAVAGLAPVERVLVDVSVLGLIIGLLPLGRAIGEDQVLQ